MATVAKIGEAEKAEVALSQPDCILFAFSDVDAAIRTAVSIHKSLAVSSPVVGLRGSLLARSAIHPISPDEIQSEQMESLLNLCARMAGQSKDGQTLISSTARDAAGNMSDKVEFRLLLDELELPGDDPDGGLKLYEVVPVVRTSLTPEEHAELSRQPPESRSAGGLPSVPSGATEAETGELVLTLQDLERIARYAHDYRGGGWQNRLPKNIRKNSWRNTGANIRK